MIHNGLRLLGDAAAQVRAAILAGGAGDDVDDADDQGHGLGQNVEVKLRAGDDEEQDVQRHRPAVHTLHQLLGGGADVAEDGAGHHAHQQQGESAVDGADLEFQHTHTHRQHDEGDGQRHTLAAGVEEPLHPVEQQPHKAAETHGQENLHDGLNNHGQHADLPVGQCRRNAEGHGEQQQTHGVVQGDHQHQQPGHGAVRLVLTNHHQRGGRGGGGGDGAQGDGAGDGNDVREEQMQQQKYDIHDNGGDHGLQNADDDGAGADGAQLTQTELVAHGKGDEAQGGLADDAENVHLVKGVEAQAGDIQPPQEERPEKQSGHQVGRDGGKMQQSGKAGHKQSADQCYCQTNQINLHNFDTFFSQKPTWQNHDAFFTPRYHTIPDSRMQVIFPPKICPFSPVNCAILCPLRQGKMPHPVKRGEADRYGRGTQRSLGPPSPFSKIRSSRSAWGSSQLCMGSPSFQSAA